MINTNNKFMIKTKYIKTNSANESIRKLLNRTPIKKNKSDIKIKTILCEDNLLKILL